MKGMIIKMKTKQKLLAGILMAIICLTSFSGIVRAEIADETLQSKIDASKSGEVISLDKDYTESITIGSDKNITIDLNGHNIITSEDAISNYGTLTIKGDGKVQSTKGAVVNYPNATISIDNGSYNSTGWYTIKNMGTMTINNLKYDNNVTNGASLIANGFYGNKSTDRNQVYSGKDAVLTINGGTFTNGNNSSAVIKNDDGGSLIINKGNFISETVVSSSTAAPVIMNWNKAVINGGTFESKTGSVLANGYCDAEKDVGELTINGGTFTAKNSIFALNGGASTNKGIVSIKGGTFNGEMTNLPQYDGKYYTIAVTGGTFTNTKNAPAAAEGYAVYETSDGYEVAKKATFENSLDKVTVAVNDVKDLEIKLSETSAEKYLKLVSNDTSIATVENGKVKGIKVGKTTITATLEEKNTKTIEVTVYKVDVADESKESEAVSEQVQNMVEDIISGKNVANLTENQQQAIQEAVGNGKIIETEVETNSVKEENVKEDSKKIESIISSNEKVATYYDINVILKDAITNQEITKLTNLSDKIKITLDIPEDLPAVQEGYTRIFNVIRVHDGKAEKLTTVNNGDNTITFETDKFSTYALAYKDVANKTENNINNPNTGDSIVLFISIFAVASVGVVIITRKLNKIK